MNKIVSKIKPDYKAKKRAFPYQMEAFMTVKDMDYSAIFHEQGLGKTKIAIDLLLYWLQKKDIDTVLIVTKKQLVKNWLDEFSIHTYIKPKTLSSNKYDNFYVLNSPAKVIITNFETLSTDKERMGFFLKSRNVAIIIDESTKIKNPKAKLTQDFFDLAELFKIRTIMTGTPIANRPYDIWAQIYFLDKGVSLGENFEDFKQKTDLSNNLLKDNISRHTFENFVSEIYSKISNFSVRETKKSCSIELPQKVYNTIYAKPEKTQYEMYIKVLKDLKIEVESDNKRVLDDDTVALKRLLRLMQIASNPKLIDDKYNKTSGKDIQLENTLKSITNNNEKCIVWSSFIENIEWFSKKYVEYNPQKVHGAISIDERNKALMTFMKNETCKVLFATPQSAKEGLTLTVANHVIFYDRGFNLDDYLQAQDRIHRISQRKTCYIYNIMVENSIDEWISKLLEAKQYAAFLAQGDMQLSEYIGNVDYSYSAMMKEILDAGEERA
jgi:SNF2 family DNA or RNA helicase